MTMLFLFLFVCMFIYEEFAQLIRYFQLFSIVHYNRILSFDIYMFEQNLIVVERIEKTSRRNTMTDVTESICDDIFFSLSSSLHGCSFNQLRSNHSGYELSIFSPLSLSLSHSHSRFPHSHQRH